MNWKQCSFTPTAKVFYSIFISTQVCLFLVFFANQNFKQQNQSRPMIHPYANVTLMGQFNYVSNSISTWRNAWSHVVNPNNIVIAAPNDASHPYPKEGRYKFYQGDAGYYSPYINMANVIRENRDIPGLLYVHDDMLLSSSIFRKLGGNEWIATNFKEETFAIYENSTFDSPGAPTWWNHWSGCVASFIKIFNDKRLNHYKHQSTNGTSFINVRKGASDMLYIFLPNSEQRTSFLSLLDLFAENKLFLECAIPTAISMMQERFGIKIHSALLCTDWGSLRAKPKDMIEKCSKEGVVYESYHPIKISLNSNWTQYFDYARNL